jgi:hypothetical protein
VAQWDALGCSCPTVLLLPLPLLQPITSKTFIVSLLVEFIGVMIFTFLGSTVTDKVHGPWVNGLALAIWIYSAANISGKLKGLLFCCTAPIWHHNLAGSIAALTSCTSHPPT